MHPRLLQGFELRGTGPPCSITSDDEQHGLNVKAQARFRSPAGDQRIYAIRPNPLAFEVLLVHACRVSALPGETEAGKRLKQTALRDFGPVAANNEHGKTSYKLSVSPHDVPVPDLLRYALKLIGLESGGPGEKVAWWVSFMYRSDQCELALQKFGLRLWLWSDASEQEANKSATQIMKKLRSSVRIVEKLILNAAPELLGNGNATVVNQHHSLRQAYEYFRERATNPFFIGDEHEEWKTPDGRWSGSSFTSGSVVMQMHAFHDMVAAITAYLSLLEHDLVLVLAFSGFDPAKDDLIRVIGSRWGEKFERLFGKQGDAALYRQRLTDVVERWRNPYSHGGFEKGHGATIYLHVPGVNAALPVGLTAVRDSPLFSFLPANETDVAQVFELFDAIDGWISSQHPEAMKWIGSALAVRFDEDFRQRLDQARQNDGFDDFLCFHDRLQDRIDNMDY